MEYNNELCRDLISVIVDTYNENYEKCKKSKSRVSCIGIDFVELFSSEKLDIQIGERHNDFVFRVKGEQLNSRSKNLRKRIIKASNVSNLVFSDLLQVINLLQKLENENLIILSNRLKFDRFPRFDEDEENNITYININNQKIEEYIKENYYAQIIPTTTLIDIANNDFKSIEQRRFEEQLEEAKDSTCWSRIAAILAFFTLAITFFQTCCNKQNNSEQLNSIITAIKEHKTVSIDSVKVLPADTFNVNVIQPKAKPTPKPQKKNPLNEQIPNQ